MSPTPQSLPGWTRPDRGALFVVTGPSGVGKSTLIKQALSVVPDLSFSVSATTRAPREGEVDGVHYHFMDPAAFDAQVEQGQFLEWATVYGRSYGTLREPVQAALDAGQSILLDIDVEGSRQVRAAGMEAVHILVLPPDLDTLEERLRARGTDDDEIIGRRMDQVETQLRGVGEFDYLVVNDDLQTAHRSFEGILLAALCRRERRQGLIRSIHRMLDSRVR